MNNKKISISLPKPCDENWDTMTPADRGRHCAQCCKTVVDFTLLSDGEIIDIFKKAKDNPPCGHFLETQLDRELVDTRYKHSFFSGITKRAAAMLILFQSVTIAALAQQVRKAPAGLQAGKEKPNGKNSKRQICGHVFRYESNEPLGGVNVQILGTQINGVTDKYGMFVLDLPDTFYMASIMLEGSIVGSTANDMVIEEGMSFNDVVNNKELVLYAYKVQTLKQHDLIRPDIANIRTYGGLPVRTQVDLVRKPGIWKRITRPFRSKKHN